MKVYLDFETRSECDLKSNGAWAYSMHHSTSILCMCWKLENLSDIKIWKPEMPLPFDLLNLFSGFENVICAHNASFEYAIWNNCCVKKYGFPELPLELFYCSMARSSYFGLPRSLEGVCLALGTKAQKDMSGKKLMMKYSRPRKGTKDNSESWYDINNDEFKNVIEYCKDDVKCEEAISSALPELPDYERKIWLLNETINNRGVGVDKELLLLVQKELSDQENILLKEIETLTNGKVKSVRQHAATLAFLKGEGVESETMRKGDVAEMLTGDISQVARRLLEIRQSLGMASTAKIESMLNNCCDDNRVRGSMMYFGANTGRFAGRGIQVHNFPRGDYDKDYFKGPREKSTIFKKTSENLRGFLVPQNGNEFFVGDFASIEARVLFWIANHKIGLKMYRDNIDLYLDMAAYIYGVPLETLTKKSPERHLGKQVILGAGYGLGHKKFLAICETNKIDMTLDLAQKAITAYRTRHKPVQDFWYSCENAAIKAVMNPDCAQSINEHVCYAKKRDWLFCKLPSGRYISYYKPKIIEKETPFGKRPGLQYMGMNSTTKKYEYQDTYGGRLCENIVQAASRDLLCESMTQLENNGYGIVMTVHDEIVAEVKGRDLKEFTDIMRTPPLWASNCPIEVEVFKCDRYRK